MNRIIKVLLLVFAITIGSWGSGVFTLDAEAAIAELYWPVRSSDGTASTSINTHIYYYGHRGIDIQAHGCSYYSATDGTVYKIYSGCTTNGDGNHGNCKPTMNGSSSQDKKWKGCCNYGFGNGVVIKSTIGGATYYVQYPHMNSVNSNLRVGQSVKKGDFLGVCGDRGFSFGVHGHFEINKDSEFGTLVNNDPSHSGCVFTYNKSKLAIAKPDAVSSVTVSSTGIGIGDSVTATWKASARATSYDVKFECTSNSANSFTVKGVKATSLQRQITKNGTYKVTVVANNSAGASAGKSSSAITVYPNCTVRFNDWDGTLIKTVSVKWGGSCSAGIVPTREGYSFQGWDKSSSGIKADTTITAQYKINSYSVKFVDYEGNTVSLQQVEYGKSATEPATSEIPAKAGYVFNGWASDEYKNVKKALTIEPVYVWGNANLPIVTEITKAERDSEGSSYSVTVKMTNFPNDFTKGKLIVSLYTQENKLVASEIRTINMPTEQEAVENITLLYSGVATRVQASMVGVVDDNTTGTPKSKVATSNVEIGEGWSDWSGTKPEDEDITVQTRTEYRYKDKKTIKATTKPATPAGYTYSSSESTGTYTAYGAWSGWGVTAKTSSTTRKVETRTTYRYYHYKCSKCGTHDPYGGACSNCKSSVAWVEDWGTVSGYKYSGGYQVNSSLWPGKGRIYWQSGYWYFTLDNNPNYWTGNGQPTRKEYRSADRQLYYNYHYWQTDFSEWQAEPVTATSEKQVETRTAYRYKANSTGADLEDKAGTVRNVSGSMPGAAGKVATLIVYKGNNSDPTENQIEYIGQTAIGSDGSYAFAFKTKEEPSVKTGDFIITLGVEGATNYTTLGKIEAPKPTYTVEFLDMNGNSITTLTSVEEGSTVEAPVAPEVTGYVFDGWDTGLTNVHDNMIIKAEYSRKDCAVVFVDWDESYVGAKIFKYGDEISFDDYPTKEGSTFTKWVDERGNDALTVTGDMVVTAEYRDAQYTVTFLDFDGNIIKSESVGYGESVEAPQIPEDAESNILFSGWDSRGAENYVTEDMTISPLSVYRNTAVTPEFSVASGTYQTEQKVFISTETEDADIYYFTIDKNSEEESALRKYSSPVRISSNTMLCAYAVADEMNVSDYSILDIDITSGESERRYVTNVSLDKTALTIEAGESVTLHATVTPEDADDTSIRWQSSDESVVTVTSDGVVHGISKGTAYISAMASDQNTVGAVCEITVEQEEIIKGEQQIAIPEQAYSKSVADETFNLNASLTKGNGKLSYSSSDDDVVSVDSNGQVTINGEGNAVIEIIASETDEFLPARIEILITVTEDYEDDNVVAVEEIILNTNKLSMEVGDREKLVATIKPANASAKNLLWYSFDETIAKVSEGSVEAVGAGATSVIAVALDGSGVKAVCQVNVSKAEKKTPSFTGTPFYQLNGDSAAFDLDVVTNSNGTLSYSSDDSSVVRVSPDGRVEVIGGGLTSITVESTETEQYEAGVYTIVVYVSGNRHEHSYQSTITKQPTCSEEGEVHNTCSTCGDTTTKVIPAGNHVAKMLEDMPASMEADGYYGKTVCDICGEVINQGTVINKISRSIELDSDGIIYNGADQKPKLSVKDTAGRVLVENTDYVVAYANNRNAGNGTAIVSFIGNYQGFASKVFSIAPCDISSSNVSVKTASSSYVYTGGSITPAVIIGALTSDDYRVEYSNNTKVGTAKAEITGRNNCIGTKTITFKIYPKQSKISSAKVGKNKVTVKMSTKVASTGGTSYQIQYRIKGTSKWKTTTTTSQSKTISKLKKGKKYQIRVRAKKSVSGTTYYGKWSTVKSTNKVK